MSIAIKAEHVSKEYRLGIINHGMLFKDLKSWWAKKRGKEDPYSKIGTHHFDDQPDRFWALKDVSFEIEQGDRVGIIGRNGAGKSTLLKILSRITEPTEGRILIKGRVASLLEVGTGFHPELTGRDNIYLNGAIRGMKKREIDNRIDAIIDFSEIEKFIDTPVKRYSSGMFVRLGFAVAAFLDSEILVADEVLAVGDQAFQNKCLGKMEDVSSQEGRTVIFVSHNIGSVVSLCTNGILLDKGSFIATGSIRDVAAKYTQGVIGNEVLFTEGSRLSWAKVEQRGRELFVEATYQPSEGIDTPCLAASFYDFMGVPIFIANSRNYSQKRVADGVSVGKISFRIVRPALHDGEFLVTLHFGDSKTDFEYHTHCIKILIEGMSNSRTKAYPEYYGFVFPEMLDYKYS